MIVVSVAFVAIACLLPLSETSKQSGTQRHPETPSETTDSEQHRMTNCMMNQFAHTYTHTHIDTLHTGMQGDAWGICGAIHPVQFEYSV